MAAKTYAQEAKTIMNKYKLRLGDKFDKGDPLALAAMNAELTTLQQEQEEAREVKFQADNADKIGAIQQFANGGKLNKKQQTTLSEILNESLPQYTNGGDVVDPLPAGIDLGIDPNQYVWGGADIPSVQQGIIPGQQTSPADPVRAAQTIGEPGGGIGDGFKSRVPWIGAAAQGIGSLLMNRDIDLPEYEYEEYKPTRGVASLVDLSRQREQIQRERDRSQALITRSARGTGSQAGLMENILAGATGTQRVAGEQFGESLEREQTINAQIRNQMSQFNAAQQAQAAQINMRNKLYSTQLGRESVLFKEQRRRGRIGGLTGAVTGYAKDRLAAGQYDQMVNMELGRNPNFGLTQADPTFWRKMAGITDPITDVSFRNTGDRTANI